MERNIAILKDLIFFFKLFSIFLHKIIEFVKKFKNFPMQNSNIYCWLVISFLKITTRQAFFWFG